MMPVRNRSPRSAGWLVRLGLALALLASPWATVEALVDDRHITIASAADVSSKRQELIQFIWGSAGFPGEGTPLPRVGINVPSPVRHLENLERVDNILITMDAGERSVAHHFIPRRRNNRLVIVHHGHACTLNDNPTRDNVGFGLQRTINGLLAEGYSVLGMYMPHQRPGDCRPDLGGHNAMFDIKTTGSPLKFFLEPVAVSVNYLKTQFGPDRFPRYQEFSMVGLSGGGWAATVYAALDPTIQFSFPVAGTIPLYFRAVRPALDLEYTLDAFYRIAGYPDLYVMGSFGPGRKQIQILNRRDNCCFGEAQHNAAHTGMSFDQAVREYELRVRDALSRLGSGTFRVEIDEAAPAHMISWHAIKNIILPELDQRGR